MSDIARTSAGPGTWFDSLPSDVQSDLNQIKAALRGGLLQRGRRHVARTISKHLKERGISTIGHNGVDTWLAKD